jgi:hypothetical protein
VSTGLLNQLESYFSDIDSEQGPVSPDHVAELIDHVREVPTPLPVRTRPRVWIAAAAFAVVLVFVGGLVVLAPFGGDNLAPADQPVPVAPTTAPDVTVTTLPDTVAPSEPPESIDALELEFTGVSVADRHDGPARAIEHGDPPITVDSPVGEITWVRYDSQYPSMVAPLPGGGHVAWDTNLASEAAVVWYTEDGREWLDWSDTETLYADYSVSWIVGDWAMTYPLGQDPAFVDDTLWKRSGGVWSQASLPDGTSRVSRPITSRGMELMAATGGPVDFVIATTDDSVVYYEAPWKPSGNFEPPEGQSNEDSTLSWPTLEVQPNPQGGFVALRWPPLEAWSTSDGYSWVSVDELLPEAPGAYGFASANRNGTLWLEIWSMASEGAPTTFSYRSSTDGVNWIQATPESSPSGGNFMREDHFYYGSQRPVDTPVALFLAYAAHPSYRASLNDGATWVEVPGPPWVAANSYRALEGIYRATEGFLLAADPEEGWIGTFNE